MLIFIHFFDVGRAVAVRSRFTRLSRPQHVAQPFDLLQRCGLCNLKLDVANLLRRQTCRVNDRLGNASGCRKWLARNKSFCPLLDLDKLLFALLWLEQRLGIYSFLLKISQKIAFLSVDFLEIKSLLLLAKLYSNYNSWPGFWLLWLQVATILLSISTKIARSRGVVIKIMAQSKVLQKLCKVATQSYKSLWCTAASALKMAFHSCQSFKIITIVPCQCSHSNVY